MGDAGSNELAGCLRAGAGLLGGDEAASVESSPLPAPLLAVGAPTSAWSARRPETGVLPGPVSGIGWRRAVSEAACTGRRGVSPRSARARRRSMSSMCPSRPLMMPSAARAVIRPSPEACPRLCVSADCGLAAEPALCGASGERSGGDSWACNPLLCQSTWAVSLLAEPLSYRFLTSVTEVRSLATDGSGGPRQEGRAACWGSSRLSPPSMSAGRGW